MSRRKLRATATPRLLSTLQAFASIRDPSGKVVSPTICEHTACALHPVPHVTAVGVIAMGVPAKGARPRPAPSPVCSLPSRSAADTHGRARALLRYPKVQEATVTGIKDPICGMMVDPGSAPGRSRFEGTTYYFCSVACLRHFEAEPARYADGSTSTTTSTTTPAADLERHEPPYTKWGGLVAPKFGAAGSGGSEYERLPEAHDDDHENR